jgi:hypothetical protein
MNRPTNGWKLLCVVVLLVAAATAVGTAQSTNTTANDTATQNTTLATVAATTTGTEPPSTTGTSPSATATANGTATLSQSPTQASRSDQAADDSPDNATAIEIGETVTGNLPVGDQDWSKFTLESGGQVTVSVTAQNQTNLSAFLYSGEDLLESSFVDPGEQISLTTPVDSGGQYYVFVRNEANDTAGTYAFEVSKSEATSQPTQEATENTDSDGDGSGLGFWTLAFLGGLVLLGYLGFRRGGGDEDEENQGGENEDEGEEEES